MTDWSALRADTRGCEQVTHLNNSGAALPPSVVVDSVVNHLRLEESLGPYEAAATKAAEASRLYSAAAEIIGGRPNQIAFCDSASRAWNTIVYSLPLAEGDVILTSRIEFGSGLIALQHVAERVGARLVEVPSDGLGVVDVDALDNLMAGTTPSVIAVTHAAAHSGAVNPVEAIGQRANAAGSMFLVDACQSIGQMSVDVSAIGCDALTATGRKWLRGPRGTGFLYVSSELIENIDPISSDLVTADYLIEGEHGSHLRFRTDGKKFELWERSIAGAIGLGVAIDYLAGIGVPDVQSRIRYLTQIIIDGLADIPAITLWTPSEAVSGVVGFVVADMAPDDFKQMCADQRINISTMADWDAPLDFAAMGATQCIRVAPHYYNDESEIGRFIELVRSIV